MTQMQKQKPGLFILLSINRYISAHSPPSCDGVAEQSGLEEVCVCVCVWGLGLVSLPKEVSCVQSWQREGGLGLVSELLRPRHAQLSPDRPFSACTANAVGLAAYSHDNCLPEHQMCAERGERRMESVQIYLWLRRPRYFALTDTGRSRVWCQMLSTHFFI